MVKKKKKKKKTETKKAVFPDEVKNIRVQKESVLEYTVCHSFI